MSGNRNFSGGGRACESEGIHSDQSRRVQGSQSTGKAEQVALSAGEVTLDDEGNDQHRILHEGADFAFQGLGPIVLTMLGLFRFFWKPSRHTVPVIEILPSENRFQHSLSLI